MEFERLCADTAALAWELVTPYESQESEAASISESLRADFQCYLDLEKNKHCENITWDLQPTEEDALLYVGKFLERPLTCEVKCGLTTSPFWRMTGVSDEDHGSNMVPHNKHWKFMQVVYADWGERVGSLEERAIGQFRENPKVLNELPGGEQARTGEPSFFYVVWNRLCDVEEFWRRARKRIVRQQQASNVARKACTR